MQPHFSGSDKFAIFTNKSAKIWTALDIPQLDTVQYKFGAASGLFLGNDDDDTCLSSGDLVIANGESCTFKCWFVYVQ